MRSPVPLVALVVVAAVAAVAPWAGSAPSALPPVQKFTEPTTASGHSNPSWSPDGSRIAFEDRDSDPYNPSLYYKDYPAGSEAMLAASHREGVAYSPDGSKIAYARVDGTWYHIYIRDAAGGAETAVTSGQAGPLYPPGSYGDWQPSFSPDGQWIAFASSRGDITNGQYDVWVVKVDGTGIKKIADGGYDASFWPTWEPSGNAIVYSFNADLYRVPRTGPLTWGTSALFAANGNHPRFSHDGRFLAFDFNKDIVVMNYTTKVRYAITSDGAASEDYAPTWGPADNEIAFSSKNRGGDPNTAIWVATGIQAVPTTTATLGRLKADYR